MDDSEEKYELLAKFLRNGMNISQFHFQGEDDKVNLFEMYKEYMNGLNADKRDIETTYDFEDNLVIMIDRSEFCTFEITPDYKTLVCHTIHDLPDEDLVFILTTFFLTLKELSSMIEKLAEVFRTVSPGKSAIRISESDKPKYKALPPSVVKSMNKIKELQKSILSENKKYDYQGEKDD